MVYMFSQLDLDPSLCHALEYMGYTQPTSIQELVIPPAMEGKDILASAPTGTGKTAAFLLPVCQYMLDFPFRASDSTGSCRVLILTPTRELANQVYEQALKITKYTDLVCGVITGGINYGTDNDTLDKKLDILVATPGRLYEHIENEKFKCENIESLILDEADRMLDMGFSTVVNQIALESIMRKQSMLFSATLEGSGIERFAKDILKEPVELEANPSRKEQGKIHQWMYLADDNKHKLALLIHILKNQIETAIVFVKTRERLASLIGQLNSAGINCCWLQGEMPQDKRMEAMARFKSGEVKVLVATDVAARGIDVADISHVINYDMPRTADIYLHRIGRTGRAGKKGTAISLVEAHDIGMVPKVERYTEQKIPRRVIDELRPQNKEPKPPVKKKKPKIKGTKAAIKKAKVKKSKGKKKSV